METASDHNPQADASAELGSLIVDRDAEVPIGVQLAWALRSRIGEGQLAAGERLPGLRELAEASGVNVNTARAVYQRLEQEGLIESQQGSGTFVAATSRARSPVGKIAAGAAREALETGIDPREVAAALYVLGEPSARALDAGAERRRVLRAQISALERTLAEMEAAYPALVPTPSGLHSGAGVGPTLLSAEELEQVRAGLVRQLAAIQEGIDSQQSQRDSRERRSASQPARAAKQLGADIAKKRSGHPRGSTRPATAGT
jgi:DNA-binding transcriptional regulator YhcF (GntR family)